MKRIVGRRKIIRILMIDQIALKVSETPTNVERTPGMKYTFFFLMTINMLLTTSPYSLPYVVKESGIFLSLLFFIAANLISYHAEEMIVETIAYASVKNFDPAEICPIEDVPEDDKIKDSQYFIKRKFELYSLCKTFGGNWLTIISMLILIMYMVGNLVVKCISSCLSLTEAVSYALYGDLEIINEKWGFDPYFISVIIFALIATVFSLGNIENSIGLQLVIVIFRLLFL